MDNAQRVHEQFGCFVLILIPVMIKGARQLSPYTRLTNQAVEGRDDDILILQILVDPIGKVLIEAQEQDSEASVGKLLGFFHCQHRFARTRTADNRRTFMHPQQTQNIELVARQLINFTTLALEDVGDARLQTARRNQQIDEGLDRMLPAHHLILEVCAHLPVIVDFQQASIEAIGLPEVDEDIFRAVWPNVTIDVRVGKGNCRENCVAQVLSTRVVTQPVDQGATVAFCLLQGSFIS